MDVSARSLAVALTLHLQEANEDIQEELDRLAARLTEAALQTARCNPLLARRLELRLTSKGVAETSAVQILGERSVLPGDRMARQWVAPAGLDPRPTPSGTCCRCSLSAPSGSTDAAPGALRPLRTFAPSREAVG